MASPTIDQFSGLVASVAIKAPARVATTGAITLSGLQNVDGVALVDGDRVLVKDQTDGSQNGIWNAAVGDWSRAADCDDNNDLVTGSQVRVTAGTLGAGVYNLTSLGDIVIGTSFLTFALDASGGGGGGGPATGGINVGDFGLGGTSANYVEVTNANAATTQGFYTVPSSWTGSPYAGTDVNNQGYLEVQPWESSSYCRQTFTSTSGTRLQRVLNNGTWSSWGSYYLPLAGGTVTGSLGVTGTLTAGAIVSSGAVTVTGNVKLTGTNSEFVISAAAGTNSLLEFDVGTAARWALGRGSAAETGSGNTGSDFALLSYSDTGTLIGTALSFVRATMAANFGGTLSENGARVYSANNPPPGSGSATDYTSSTTWTKPASGRMAMVECWGGGGGGAHGNVSSGNGGGGGGGGYTVRFIPFSLLPSSVTITVGAGGGGGTGGGTNGAAGGAGGTSSFGTYASAGGGAGGLAGAQTASAGGFAIFGETGGTGGGTKAIAGGGGGTNTYAPDTVMLGGGGGAFGNGVNGGAGGTPGSGGGGCTNAATSGGAGGVGKVRVTVF